MFSSGKRSVRVSSPLGLLFLPFNIMANGNINFFILKSLYGYFYARFNVIWGHKVHLIFFSEISGFSERFTFSSFASFVTIVHKCSTCRATHCLSFRTVVHVCQRIRRLSLTSVHHGNKLGPRLVFLFIVY